MSGTLFVVATPIGNLEDITIRALRVLREVDLVAAEDTRRTANLLAHYSISTPTLSFHAHNTRTRLPQLLARLEAGTGIALVTDAGTPGISDPGVELIHACWEKGLAVDSIPGASAPLTAAVASGFPLNPLTIFGFAPARVNDRKRWFEQLARIDDTLTFFEAPHRIRQTLTEAGRYFGGRPILLARELTKRHQEMIRAADATDIGRMPIEKGEFTLVVGPKRAHGLELMPDDDAVYGDFCRMTSEMAGGRRAVIAAVARKHGCSTKEVYEAVERRKNSGKP